MIESTVEVERRVRFFETVVPQQLKSLSLEELEAGMLSTPITNLLKSGNLLRISAESQNFKISKCPSGVKKLFVKSSSKW